MDALPRSRRPAPPDHPRRNRDGEALIAYVFLGSVPAVDVLSFSVGLKALLIVVNVAAGAAAILVTLRTLRWRRAVTRRA